MKVLLVYSFLVMNVYLYFFKIGIMTPINHSFGGENPLLSRFILNKIV